MQVKKVTRYPLWRCSGHSWLACRIRQRIQSKGSHARDAGEILVQTEETRVVFKSNGRDQGIDGCQTDAFRSSQPRNHGCLTVGGETARLKHLPQGKIVLNALDIPPKPLKDLRHDNSSEREGFDFLNHSPQCAAATA